jgi:hypothetical protein
MTSENLTPEEIDNLVAENAELRRQADVQGASKPSSGSSTFRKVLAIILAVLAIVAIAASVDAIWLKTTLQDEETFVATFQDLTRDEDVATALSLRIADDIMEATSAEAYITETLPPDLAFIAAPITDAMAELLANTAKPLIQSDAVNTAWTVTLRTTHVAVSAVLSNSEEGQVAIDLDEIASIVLDRAAEEGLTLPEVETDFGQIVIYESDELAAAESVAQTIDKLGWLLPLIALLLIVGAVWAAPDRRRITAFLGFGTALGMLLSLVTLRIGQNVTLNAIEDEITRSAGEATWNMALNRLISASWGILVFGLIIGFIAWAVGPSHRAQQFTSWVAGTVDSWRRPEEADPSGFAKFLAGSKRTIEIAVVAIGLLFILFGPSLSAVRVLIITLVVIAIIGLIEILAGPAEPTPDPVPTESEQIDA